MLALWTAAPTSFVAAGPHTNTASLRRTACSSLRRTCTQPSMLDVPRISLPDIVTAQLETKLDLQNPNELTTDKYNSYSGAAIAGTLLFFLFPGGAVFGLGDAVSSVVQDFLFSAIVGGGLGIYFSLRKDETGEKVLKAGEAIVSVPGSVLGKPLELPRLELPLIVSGLIKSQGLNSPNDLDASGYNGYSGAAILGTLIFFLLPGGAAFQIGEVPGTVLSDFVFSALIGGGYGAYLALRKDAAADLANKVGEAVLKVPQAVIDRVAA